MENFNDPPQTWWVRSEPINGAPVERHRFEVKRTREPSAYGLNWHAETCDANGKPNSDGTAVGETPRAAVMTIVRMMRLAVIDVRGPNDPDDAADAIRECEEAAKLVARTWDEHAESARATGEVSVGGRTYTLAECDALVEGANFVLEEIECLRDPGPALEPAHL